MLRPGCLWPRGRFHATLPTHFSGFLHSDTGSSKYLDNILEYPRIWAAIQHSHIESGAHGPRQHMNRLRNISVRAFYGTLLFARQNRKKDLGKRDAGGGTDGRVNEDRWTCDVSGIDSGKGRGTPPPPVAVGGWAWAQSKHGTHWPTGKIIRLADSKCKMSRRTRTGGRTRGCAGEKRRRRDGNCL